jgi:hypothetical protein
LKGLRGEHEAVLTQRREGSQRGKAATEFVDARWYDEHDEDGGWSVEDGGG